LEIVTKEDLAEYAITKMYMNAEYEFSDYSILRVIRKPGRGTLKETES